MNHIRSLVALMACLLTPLVFAGQGYIISENGTPVTWDVSSSEPISVHIEAGDCGQFTNEQMQTRLASSIGEWTGLSAVDVSFSIVTGSISGVDACNYGTFLANLVGSSDNTAIINDGLNPVVFENDGNFIEYATGQSNGRLFILGFANPAGFLTDPSDSSLITEIVDGQAVFNCYCLVASDGGFNNSDCEENNVAFSVDSLDFTMVHEIGHLLNLDHSQINDDLDNDDTLLPTMYPSAVDSASQLSPSEDDITAMASLYPSSTFFTQGDTDSTYCKVQGTLLDRFSEELRCANVQAIASGNNARNVSFVSGAYAPATDSNGDSDTQDSGECTSDCGDFTFYLRPGSTYSLRVRPVNSSFTGGSGISPCLSSQLTTCTDTIITRCTDGESSTACTACVAEETLATNDSAQTIATVISAQCTAGAVVNLGNITTDSVASTSASTQTLVLPQRDLASEFVAQMASWEPLQLSTPSTLDTSSCPESSTGSVGGSSSCTLNTRGVAAEGHGVFYFLVALLTIIFVKLLTTLAHNKKNH